MHGPTLLKAVTVVRSAVAMALSVACCYTREGTSCAQIRLCVGTSSIPRRHLQGHRPSTGVLTPVPATSRSTRCGSLHWTDVVDCPSSQLVLGPGCEGADTLNSALCVRAPPVRRRATSTHSASANGRPERPNVQYEFPVRAYE